MDTKKFEVEVRQNRPRMALMELIPVLEELSAEVKALSDRVASLEKVEPAPEPKPEAETSKKAPARKKAAAKKSAGAKAKED